MGDDIKITNDTFSNSSSDNILLNILKHEFHVILIDRRKMIMVYHFVHHPKLEWALYIAKCKGFCSSQISSI